MLKASRGSNAKATNCFIEGTISLETRSKAFLANCTISYCTWSPVEKDRLQMQIDRLKQQPAVMCESAAQVDMRAVAILNYDTGLRAQHKDSKIHCVCCQIYGCTDAAVEVSTCGLQVSAFYLRFVSHSRSGSKESFSEIYALQT